ncbi:hypothetical protein K503DRAFT_342803 [Rhizopogon vinicolor AM-OR11-026]|uniref:Uncharacterized protein n=1 Tax=Rhizopogon vinicolor AM-OR11-026 TaxID=1314800 RepID=A0A1B7MTC1_9AGAM|nr:hypothetical protein K503DRAFT_342803 [Rhizopogon vinicolor AM-OR11-026]
MLDNNSLDGCAHELWTPVIGEWMIRGIRINSEATDALEFLQPTPPMPDTIVFIASATAALAAILATSLLTPRTRVHTSVQSIQELLGPHDLPLSALLRARAKPNHRLVKALGISSTFVTDDPHVHESFTHEAKHLIAVVSAKDHGDGWMGFVDMVDICVNRYLNSESLDYATFVQSATLSIVLTGLLGADIEDLDLADVEFVTKAINDRWAQSKANDALPTEVLDQINSHITRWVPDRVNPLNLIIPAYETMWRVVAIAVVYSNRDRRLHLVQ